METNLAMYRVFSEIEFLDDTREIDQVLYYVFDGGI
jgi:hypothetical protein